MCQYLYKFPLKNLYYFEIYNYRARIFNVESGYEIKIIRGWMGPREQNKLKLKKLQFIILQIIYLSISWKIAQMASA
jgi:hypothetical protein